MSGSGSGRRELRLQRRRRRGELTWHLSWPQGIGTRGTPTRMHTAQYGGRVGSSFFAPPVFFGAASAMVVISRLA